VEWERQLGRRPSYHSEAYRAVSGTLEFWIRCSSDGWRLLAFDSDRYLGATRHPNLQAAKDAAEALGLQQAV
jgi:hypothetical protein